MRLPNRITHIFHSLNTIKKFLSTSLFYAIVIEKSAPLESFHYTEIKQRNVYSTQYTVHVYTIFAMRPEGANLLYKKAYIVYSDVHDGKVSFGLLFPSHFTGIPQKKNC